MGAMGSVASWMFGFSHQNVLLDDLIIFVAQYFPYMLGAGALFLIFREFGWRRRLLFLSELLLALIISRGLVTEFIQFFYHQTRPFEVLGFTPLIGEAGSSFPSGHAAFFFALATTIIFWNRSWGVWYFFFAFLNGLARVFAGVHWPLDIVGGAAVGIAGALFIHWLVTPYAEKLKTQPSP
ncbi:MAG: hypothetical protein A3A43_00645 [Candidatus Liptonbacteria bacterium RIFCSPLOWO2_01_FULL_56_20]|uniref:Phosphatidic acid phosphatase type 2/haloperoxidase domain-containing protein n=1 Tax=Candidatus Liptonbacteria bacterium RIFCSPLOWO2_01_FULL_56_20 TaxID=1798652 RepID=A0A1G2CKI9_9BACT|nr:MAG: hypothetical protein A2681_02555 [Candidatus Liptonbacteria bacterium RIFCSPHIGHO2_01_FULL_56_18b]OGZ01895.1 MAG: hypothetical protein A3A43_00645 [Candidatus Liptonbacteria bacterium RIFCSPLOWO2_01_FULL_56_20]